jgi:hypothetical protein
MPRLTAITIYVHCIFSIILVLQGMRVLKHVESIRLLKCMAAFLYLQVLYVAAYGELNGVRVGVDGDDPAVLREGEGERGGGVRKYQGPLGFESTGEDREGDGESPSRLDSGSRTSGREAVPTPTSPSSTAARYDGNTSTAPAPPSTAPSLTGSHPSHER